MKKLRVQASVYDRKTMEWVTRTAEVAIRDETAQMLLYDIHGQETSPIRAYGYGDYEDALPISSVLRNQKKFALDPVLEILEITPEGNNGEQIGGWRNM